MRALYQNLFVEMRDDVLWVRINRPDRRNALSRATLYELGRACSDYAAVPTLKAFVLSGTGNEAFAAGGDLDDFAEIRTVEQAGDLFDMASGALDEIRRFPVPVVAALNGVALGGGAELALACDFRLAAAHAGIGYIQARLGLSCGFGGGADLMRLLGHSRALLHGLTAATLDARQAQAIGLVDEIVLEGESLEQCAARFLDPILRQRPQVIRAYKAMVVTERSGRPPEERRAVERSWFSTTWTHIDHWSAVDMMMRKRRERTT